LGEHAVIREGNRGHAEYHVKWNLGYTSEHNCEFHSHFTMINPVELHALERVRSSMGLETPKVVHPLTSEPFYPFPEEILNIRLQDILNEDELLREIYSASKEWCNQSMQ